MFLNKVFVLGNLTADPDARTLPSGRAVVNFRMATNRVFYDKAGQKQEQAEFHNVVAFGRTAEIIQQYLKKGSMALIEGRLRTRSWQDSSGNRRFRTEIITERLQLGPRAGIRTPPTPTKEETPKEEIPIIDENEGEINVSEIPF